MTLGVAMAVDARRQEVIDADGHVVEPDTVWSDYAEPEFRERLDVPGGGVQALGIGRAYPAVSALPLPSKDDDEFWAADVGGEGWDDDSRTKMGRPGGYDPHARLVDMASRGYGTAVPAPRTRASASNWFTALSIPALAAMVAIVAVAS